MQRRWPWKDYGRYGTVGIELVVSMLLGYYLGHYADERWGGAHGWMTLAGVVVGVYAGFRALFKAGAQMARDADREEREERAAWQRKLREDERTAALRDGSTHDARDASDDADERRGNGGAHD